MSNKMRRRERKRKRNEEKPESEDSEDIVIRQTRIVVAEESKSNNSRTLTRSATFTVSAKPRNAFGNSASADEKGNDNDRREEESHGDDDVVIRRDATVRSDSDDSKLLTRVINNEIISSAESKNLTYDLEDGDNSSKHDTYNVRKVESDAQPFRPVPAPRARLSYIRKGSDKQSSDTDRDIMEIEIDEGNSSSAKETPSRKTKDEAITKRGNELHVGEAPKPKPRKLPHRISVQPSVQLSKTSSLSRSKSLEEISVKVVSPRSVKSDPEKKSVDASEPIVPRPKTETTTAKTKRVSEFLRRRKQKKMIPRIRLERSRLPTISSILRELRDDSKHKLAEEQDNGLNFQIDSPRLPHSEQNNKLYVQGKNGFYVKSREDVFKQGKESPTSNRNDFQVPVVCTMLKTAILFQKYWSRLSICLHGILAGLGFAHALMVTAIWYYLNEEFEKFIQIYKYLSLKIHFTFYALIGLCIISCLDRLDVGHLKTKHWGYICRKYQNISVWFVFVMYNSSFVLTFLNQGTEIRFDDFQHKNLTEKEIFDSEMQNAQENFTNWYRILWARNMILLISWILISITEFPDHLHMYVVELASKVETNDQGDRKAIEID